MHGGSWTKNEENMNIAGFTLSSLCLFYLEHNHGNWSSGFAAQLSPSGFVQGSV